MTLRTYVTILLLNARLGLQFLALNVTSKLVQLLSCFVSDGLLLLIWYIKLTHYTFNH